MPKHGRRRDPEAQERILDATAGLVTSDGVDHVTIAGIATTAGVSRQTIYRWWPSKAAVVLDALDRVIVSANPVPRTGDARNLQSHTQGLVTFLKSPAGPHLRALFAESLRDEAVAAQFRAAFIDNRRERGATVRRRGIEAGVFRSDLDVEWATEPRYGPIWLRFLLEDTQESPGVGQLIEHLWPALVEGRRSR